jgi:dTDP-glucose pyrophosphorylase
MVPSSDLVGIITAAGRSSRLGAVAEVVPKAFLPLAPLPDGTVETPLSRMLQQLKTVGVVPVVVVHGDNRWFRREPVESDGIIWADAPPRGEFVAVERGRDAALAAGIRPDAWIVASVDNVIGTEDLERLIRVGQFGQGAVTVGAAKKKTIEGLCELVLDRPDASLTVRDFIEKPPRSGPGLAKSGLTYLPERHLSALVRSGVDRDRFGERSMTSALLKHLQLDGTVRCAIFKSGFIDVGSTAGWAEATCRLRRET